MSNADDDRTRLLLDWASMRLQRSRVPNVFDNALYSLAEALASGSISKQNTAAAIDLLEGLVDIDRSAPLGTRLVPLADRLREVGGHRALPPLGYLLGQGVNSAPTWKGRPFYKSVWDLALYNELLWELRPGAIVELGSGDGASADWFATMSAAFGLSAEVVSFDAEPPAGHVNDAVTFVAARFPEDAELIPAWCETLEGGRPWLIIEDMHVGIDVVLPAVALAMRPGDYLVVEDSGHKQKTLDLLAAGPVSLDVDQNYTDRFGTNGTSATNSVLRVR